ncbi:MAG: porin family protein [Bacteroidota bacterium]
MKKQIILIAAFFALSIVGKSQTFSIGPKAGVNISNLTNLDKLESKAGLIAGGFMMYSIIEHFGIGLDILYSNEGAKYVYEVNDGNDFTRYQFKADLNYLRFNVPLTIFLSKREHAVRPKIFAGPTFAFLLSARNKSELISSSNNAVSTLDGTKTVTDDFNRVDFGGLIGAGINFRLAESVWLDVDASYHADGIDIVKNPPSGSDPVHNVGLAFSAGLGFGF